MKTLKTTLLLAIIALTTSCSWDFGEKGNGNVVQEKRLSGIDFDKISSSAGTDVYITQGNINEIIVETDENLLAYLQTDISNGELRISTSQKMGRATTRKVYVTFKEIKALSASSGSEVVGKSIVKSEDLSLSTSSGSEIKIRGKASNFIGKASSGSEISAEKLEVISATAQASSGAEIKIAVKENLDAKASSGGSIRYAGDPQILNANKSSSGSVKKI